MERLFNNRILRGKLTPISYTGTPAAIDEDSVAWRFQNGDLDNFTDRHGNELKVGKSINAKTPLDFQVIPAEDYVGTITVMADFDGDLGAGVRPMTAVLTVLVGPEDHEFTHATIIETIEKETPKKAKRKRR